MIKEEHKYLPNQSNAVSQIPNIHSPDVYTIHKDDTVGIIKFWISNNLDFSQFILIFLAAINNSSNGIVESL